MSTSILTRRNLIAVVPPAALAAALPACAGSSPDAGLLSLAAAYEQTLVAMNEAAKPHSSAETIFYAMRSAEPARDVRSIRKASGLVTAERRYNLTMAANQRVIDQVIETPAVTIRGACFKARISAREDNMNPELVASLIDDLVALDGGLDA